jgi:hypothetical protein
MARSQTNETRLLAALLDAAFDDSDETLNAADRIFDCLAVDLHRRFTDGPSSEFDLLLAAARERLSACLSRMSRSRIDVDRAVSVVLQLLSQRA